jgi:NTE family protein
MIDVTALPRPLAFVLSGGSNLGAVQVGMLRGLRRAGIQPDIVVGASVGAMNGAMVAADPETGADRLTEVWLSLSRRDVFPSRLPMQLVRLARTRTHLQTTSGLRALMTNHLDARTFEDLVVPLGVVATDVELGEPVVITHGSVADAVMASTAIPAIFPVVEREGRRLFDGGVSANLPVYQAVSMGARSLVILDAGAPTARPNEARSFQSIVTRATSLLLRHQPRADLAAVSIDVPTVVLPTPIPTATSVFDFKQTPELLFAAEGSTLRLLGQMGAHARLR